MEYQTYGIFFLGSQPVVVPNGAVIQSPANSAILTPQQYSIIKTIVSAPEGNAVASGPNYPVTYNLNIHVAPNQTLNDAYITDTLDTSIRYVLDTVSFIAPTPTLIISNQYPPATGFYNSPDLGVTGATGCPNMLAFNFGSMNGSPITGTDYNVQFQVYTDYYECGTLIQVISSPDPMNSVLVPNTASLYNGVTGPLINSSTVNYNASPL